ncbi:MAG: hypothetical protein J5636_07160 [Clostridiales bacterium]|nr:hypothetical protein [Clostridiales bacterium]
MRRTIKVMAVVGIAVVIMSKCGVTKMKKANFVDHQQIKTMNIGIDEIALDKDACKDAAEEISENHLIEGMSEKAMAKEIYAHIFIHDVVEAMPSFLQNNKIVSRIYNSTANGIDLEDFGDTYVRQIMYDVIWLLG